MLTELKRVVLKVVSLLTGGRYPGSPPRNPYAGVRSPRRRNPNDRSSAVALLEPDDEE